MTVSTYNTFLTTLMIVVAIAFALMIYSCVAMIVTWKSPKRRRHLARLLVSIATISLSFGIQQAVLWWVFLPELGRQQVATIDAARTKYFNETTYLKVGDTIPSFTVTTIDGEMLNFPSTNRVVLISFFATWCGPCLLELPHIERIWAELKSDDSFQMVVIGREETVQTVQEFRVQHGYSFPIAADPDRKIFSLFASESIPRTMVISPEGQVIYSKSGFIESDLEELKKVLLQQLAAPR